MQEENKETTESNPQPEQKKGAGYYFGFMDVLTYYFRKPDPSRPRNFNLRAMHTINKISILLFLFALIIWIVRRLG